MFSDLICPLIMWPVMRSVEQMYFFMWLDHVRRHDLVLRNSEARLVVQLSPKLSRPLGILWYAHNT